MDQKYDPSNLFLKSCKYDQWYKKDEEKSKSQPEETIAERAKLILWKRKVQKESDDTTKSVIPPITALESDGEEIKEGKGLKLLTPVKLLTKLPILLAQIKAGNNLCKLKNEIRQILYLLYRPNKITQKSLQKFNQVIIVM